MPTIVTYTADISICSQICRLAIEEHGLQDAEDIHVDIEYAMDNYEPWFARIQPSMTVPVLKHGETYVGDSREILYFLANTYPDAGLYPAEQRAEIDAFIASFYDKFMAIGIFTFGNLIARSEALKDFIVHGKTHVTIKKLERLAQEPELADTAAAKLEEVRLRDFSLLGNQELLASVESQIQQLLEGLARSLTDGEDFVTGKRYTLADVVATALLARVHFIKGETMFSPRILDYWRAMQARPSFDTANVCATWESTLMSQQFETYQRRPGSG